tara:strand:- start:153 stop:686 length:534 start_codon:yes stop_codon:yes gene_type:complete
MTTSHDDQKQPVRADAPGWHSATFETYVALILVILAATFIILIPYQIQAPKLMFGRSFASMEPTLFPTISGFGLLLVSVIYLIQSFRVRTENPFRIIGFRSALRIVIVFGILSGYGLLFEPLGFILSSALAALLISVYLGNRGIISLVLISVALPSLTFYIFTYLLQVSLPEGVFSI